MPKFNGQNKKRIDPRYFLNETTNRDNIDEGVPYDDPSLFGMTPDQQYEMMYGKPRPEKSSKTAKSITYTVRKDEDDGGPTVILQGVDMSFEELVGQLDGQVIDFDDGDPPEVFNFSDMNGAEDAQAAAEYMIQNGIAKYYVEAWAKMNDMQAIQKGARD